MSRRLGPVLAIFAVLFAAACEDDPDDLNYLKAGSGGSSTTAGKGASGGGGAAGKAGASSDADAG